MRALWTRVAAEMDDLAGGDDLHGNMIEQNRPMNTFWLSITLIMVLLFLTALHVTNAVAYLLSFGRPAADE